MHAIQNKYPQQVLFAEVLNMIDHNPPSAAVLANIVNGLKARLGDDAQADLLNILHKELPRPPEDSDDESDDDSDESDDDSDNDDNSDTNAASDMKMTQAAPTKTVDAGAGAADDDSEDSDESEDNEDDELVEGPESFKDPTDRKEEYEA
jgi:hypothetical protein